MKAIKDVSATLWKQDTYLASGQSPGKRTVSTGAPELWLAARPIAHPLSYQQPALVGLSWSPGASPIDLRYTCMYAFHFLQTSLCVLRFPVLFWRYAMGMEMDGKKRILVWQVAYTPYLWINSNKPSMQPGLVYFRYLSLLPAFPSLPSASWSSSSPLRQSSSFTKTSFPPNVWSLSSPSKLIFFFLKTQELWKNGRGGGGTYRPRSLEQRDTKNSQPTMPPPEKLI